MPHCCVGSIRSQKFIVGTILDDTSPVNHDDPVGPASGGEPVRDDHARAVPGDPVGGVEDDRLGGGVEGGGGLVEKHDHRFDELGARQSDQLPLPGGQAASAFTDGVVESPRDRGDGGERPHPAGGILDHALRRPRHPVPDVVGHGTGEQVGLLRYMTDREPPVTRGEVTDVGAGGQHLPVSGVVEPGQQFHDGGFARARGAHHRDGGARFDAQVHTFQDGCVGVGEGDVVKHQLAAGGAARPGCGAVVGYGGGGGQQLADAAEAHGGLLVAVEDLAELLDGPEHQAHVEHERHEHTGAELPAGHLPGTQAEHERLGDLGQGGEAGEVDRHGGLGVHTQAAVLLGLSFEGVIDTVLHAVHLRGAQAGDGFLEGGVDLADLLAGLGVQTRGDLPEDQGEHHDHRHHRQRCECEGGIGDQQHAHHTDEGADRDHRLRQAGLQEGGEVVDVGGHPRHDAPRHGAFEIVHAQAQQVHERPQPQTEQETLAGPGGEHGVDGRGRPAEQHHDRTHPGDGPQGAGVAGPDTIVDGHAHQCRERQIGDHTHQQQTDDRRDEEPHLAEEPAQLKGAGLVLQPRGVDPGLLRGRGQRLHPCDQLGCGGHGCPASAPTDTRGVGDETVSTALFRHLGPQLIVVGFGGAVEFELRGARLLEIKRHEVGEPGMPVHLLQGAVGGDHTAFHQADAVGEFQGGMPVGDHEDGDIGEFLADGAEDAVLGGRIDRGGGIIEHEHPRAGQERPGQRDALPLPTGERQSTFADHLGVTIGELVDELMCLRHLRRAPHLLVGDIKPHRDVVADGGGIQERLIEHGDEVAADISAGETLEG
ncbi:putative ABC transporter ATP binding protein [Corynebacterium efficiens YS-314]|uniref:Putative ABC transporter ATP binding protein n=1 Tax=Corynebacterium efficiens (strain DSM 44549 / YS-314 / AJ 12310 / JCM 11189 / NBRC 100395) TaxID=196164 RepID=Q8FQC9_COREF|nr:putative ABC transporter ATP binding protein [Corynebacterium efficiens YS-314]